YHVRPMAEWVERSLGRQRFIMLLLSIFAALAVALAALGVYGVMSFLVAQGTREIGIRIALGATERGVVTLIVGQGLRLAALGAAAGVAGALALTRFVSSLLFGVGGGDPLTFGAVVAALVLVALVASYVPARRAARIDPMIALRSE